VTGAGHLRGSDNPAAKASGGSTVWRASGQAVFWVRMAPQNDFQAAPGGPPLLRPEAPAQGGVIAGQELARSNPCLLRYPLHTPESHTRLSAKSRNAGGRGRLEKPDVKPRQCQDRPGVKPYWSTGLKWRNWRVVRRCDCQRAWSSYNLGRIMGVLWDAISDGIADGLL
jgi:hypothetical protein